MSIVEKYSKAKNKKKETKTSIKELTSTAHKVLDIISPLLNKLIILTKMLVSLITILKEIIH